ncbi:MAG: hypothetical protein M5U27_03625 [Gaiella sp.]|nr:hypothetical protein [Gaiella sp.]
MWDRVDRATFQSAVRAAALVFVAAWLFSDDVRAWVPVWAPILVLLAAEVEFVVRGRREEQRPPGARVPPGPEDADLGFGELVEDEEGIHFLPPPPRPERSRRRLGWLVGGLVAAVVVALAVRSDRAATWSALPADARGRAEARFAAEASRIAGVPVRVRCDEGYAFTGAGSDTLGVAFPASGLTYLDPSVCRALHDLAFGGDRRAREHTTDAIIVLAHEAVHLGGERREGVTECLALQEAGPLAVRLGLDEGKARKALWSAFERRLAERTVIRASYALPASCRDGGALDRRPADPRFPF